MTAPSGPDTGETVRSFWHGAPLNPYLLLCLRSFARLGCRVEVFSYGRALRFPDWIVQREAAEIVPAEQVLVYRHGPGSGSPALHANLFRFALLEQLGGWWVDTDVALLRAPLPPGRFYFAVEEDHFGNSVMKFPRSHALPAEGAQRCRAAGSNARWGATGPTLLTELVRRHRLDALAAPAAAGCPFLWSDVGALFDPARAEEMACRSSAATFMHLCWEMWRRAGIPADLGPPAGSFLDLQFRASDLDVRFAARINLDSLAVWLANSASNDQFKALQLSRWWRLSASPHRVLGLLPVRTKVPALPQATAGNVSRPRPRAGEATRVPTVTVVIPTQSRPGMLREAAASALAQTHRALELIIVLNDATAEAIAAARSIQAGDDRVRLLFRDRGNLSAARNTGIEFARGEWIAFLDDDDVWLPEKLDVQLSTAIATGSELVTCDFGTFDEAGPRRDDGLAPLPDGLTFAEALMLGNFVSGGSAALVRTAVLRSLGGFDDNLKACEDWDMWRRIAWHHNITKVDRALVNYRWHGSSMSRQKWLMRMSEVRHLVKMAFDTPPGLRHMTGRAWRDFGSRTFPALANPRIVHRLDRLAGGRMRPLARRIKELASFGE
jgi:glycosyltransferase involved in cell wall biosynthesis